jgi:hypothetical protein
MTVSANRTIVVLDPTALPRDRRHPMASRLPDLGGRSVGFLWNHKPNGDILFARLEELLRQKHEIAGALYRQKPTASIPASEQVLDELAASADAVILGLGD